MPWPLRCNVKELYSSITIGSVSSWVEIRESKYEGTNDGWESIPEPSKGFTIPANYTCEVGYISDYINTSGDTCFEFYLYCKK